MTTAQPVIRYLTIVLLIAIALGSATAKPLLRNGDTIVFFGGRTTQCGIYTRYVMNYLAAQYPNLMISYRNAGLVGDDECNRTPGGLKRLQRDVLDQHPTWVVLAFGMDDPRYQAYDQAIFDEYMRGLTGILAVLKQQHVHALLLTPWCVSPNFKRNGIDGITYNAVLKRYADTVTALGARDKLPVADVYTPMLAMMDAASKAGTSPDTLLPDPVEPSPAVHAVIALTIAQTLCGETSGSAVSIDARAKQVKHATLCAVTKLSASADTLSFTRADNALPGFLDGEALGPVSACFPAAAQINPYRLQVTGLNDGSWTLNVAGTKIGTYTAAELASGVNLAPTGGPWRDASARINAMSAENDQLYQHYWWDVITAHTWWLPQEAEPERKELQEAVLKAIAERDKALCSIAGKLPPWEWTLTAAPPR